MRWAELHRLTLPDEIANASLRFHPRLKFGSTRTPAIVAPLRDMRPRRRARGISPGVEAINFISGDDKEPETVAKATERWKRAGREVNYC